MNFKTSLLSTAVLAGSLLVTACGGSSSSNNGSANNNPAGNSDQDYVFTIEVTNLTYAQPLSPPAIVLHDSSYQLFSEGLEASIGLEELAESGSNASLIEEAQSYDSVIQTIAGGSIILPGSSEEFTLRLDADLDDDLNGNFDTVLAESEISLVTMLVNTNDAFTGEKNIDISAFEINQSKSFNGPVWDSGTEENSETAASIPGPAANGEGFNSSRENDVNKVIFHPGVVSRDDGLSSSVLTQAHRFDQPASRIRITRIQ